jgi:hypothetical protein
MITNPAQGILSSFNKLQIPSDKPMKTKGSGMMNRKSNFTNVSDNQPTQPAITAKQIQMYVRKNRKNGGMNEPA